MELYAKSQNVRSLGYYFLLSHHVSSTPNSFTRSRPHILLDFEVPAAVPTGYAQEPSGLHTRLSQKYRSAQGYAVTIPPIFPYHPPLIPPSLHPHPTIPPSHQPSPHPPTSNLTKQSNLQMAPPKSKHSNQPNRPPHFLPPERRNKFIQEDIPHTLPVVIQAWDVFVGVIVEICSGN